ncbi:hypothetical protein MKX03_014671, partial [Papaver bracteatum]
MPVHIADEIIAYNILSRLPMRSILRFRCVCKSWCKLLKEPIFVALVNHEYDEYFRIASVCKNETLRAMEVLIFLK